MKGYDVDVALAEYKEMIKMRKAKTN